MSFVPMQGLDPFIRFCSAIPTLPYGRCVHSLSLKAEISEAFLLALPKYTNVPIWMHSARIYAPRQTHA